MDHKVTITGDDPMRLDLYSQHLRNLGYTPNSFVSTGSREDHLDNCCNVVMMEYDVAAANNFEFVKRLKQKTPTTYVILIAGKNEIERAHQAIGSRLFNVVIQMRHFFGCINEVLQQIAHPIVKSSYYNKANLDGINLRIAQKN